MRKPEEPVQAPEEPIDSRSLFERLEENKRKKQEEWDAEHDIKNVVRGIDDDEAAFLDKVDDVRTEMELKRIKEERTELENYRKMKDKLFDEEEQRRLKSELLISSSNGKREQRVKTEKKQAKLLLGAVVKKRPNTEQSDSKQPEKKQAKLGALAGLGEYSSSEDET